MIKILIVEDEIAISQLIRINLEKEGYLCTCACDGMIAADYLQDNYYDLILLDIMLPKINGYELMEYISSLEIPVIFLTAKNTVEEKVKGLLLGAEDYIVKPFATIELLARIEVVLRRFKKTVVSLNYDEFNIDIANQTVKKYDEVIYLTPKEFELFAFFVKCKNQTLYRSQIFMQVWGTEFTGDTRTLDQHVQKIRKKLGLDERLKTVFKLGYRLESVWGSEPKY